MFIFFQRSPDLRLRQIRTSKQFPANAYRRTRKKTCDRARANRLAFLLAVFLPAFLSLALFCATSDSWAQPSQTSPANVPVARFKSELKHHVDAGHLSLAWQIANPRKPQRPVVYQLEGTRSDLKLGTASESLYDAMPDDARVRTKVYYEGPDHATFVSGLLDGDFAFRVRARVGTIEDLKDATADWGPWSSTHAVEVRHHSLRSAGLFFVSGAFLFAALVVALLLGHRRVTQDPKNMRPDHE